MYCHYCGKQIPDDANLCAYCGERLRAEGRRRMVRPRKGRKIAGVCLSFAEYLDRDVTLIRVLMLLLGIFAFPAGEIAYVAAWIVIPAAPEILGERDVNPPSV
jgi:phage shock protein PspC (stress-responsive transcriptional regulator)